MFELVSNRFHHFSVLNLQFLLHRRNEDSYQPRNHSPPRHEVHSYAHGHAGSSMWLGVKMVIEPVN
jgi:hypothetical protein